MKVTILSIDAWRQPEGWHWNNWHRIGETEAEVCDLSPRKLLRRLREEGILGPGSAGKVAIQDDGYNVVILARGTREPLYAIAYGEIDV